MKYNYKLERSARKTLSVSVSAQNLITVRAPLNLPIEKIEAFLQSKESWLSKKLAENTQRLNASGNILNFSRALVGGEEYLLNIGEKNLVTNNCIYVKDLARFKDVYIKNFGGVFIERFNQISSECSLKARGVKFKSYKSRWGCCDRSGFITLNYKAMMLPPELFRYVAVHELCHTIYMDHSRRFWAEVKLRQADYLTLRNRLKDYAFLVRLYP